MLVTDRACDEDFLVPWFEGLFGNRRQRTCILTRCSTKTHGATLFGSSWDKAEKLVLLSKTKDVTIKMWKYCAEWFSININHRIFVHHIVFNVSQCRYVDSYILLSFNEILGRDWKTRKNLDAQSEIIFCSLLQWTSMNKIFSIHIVFFNIKGVLKHGLLLVFNMFCAFVVEIEDRVQYCMEEPKRGCSHPCFQHRYTIGIRPVGGASRRAGGRYKMRQGHLYC